MIHSWFKHFIIKVFFTFVTNNVLTFEAGPLHLLLSIITRVTLCNMNIILFLVGISGLIVTISGGCIPKDSPSVNEQELNGTISSDEPSLVYFASENATRDDLALVREKRGVKGFFKQLGCDIAKGTQIVGEGVSEAGSLWKSIKKGYAYLKNIFRRNEEPSSPAIIEEIVTPLEPEQTITVTVETSSSSSAPITENVVNPSPITDNEVNPSPSSENEYPEIDVRIGDSSRSVIPLK